MAPGQWFWRQEGGFAFLRDIGGGGVGTTEHQGCWTS
jgi:hypothetical protein